MRSLARDQGSKHIQFNVRTPDAASGSGIAQPGNIPYVFTRTAVGQYVYNFDPAIAPMAVVGGITQSVGGSCVLTSTGIASGQISVNTVNSAGTVTNMWHGFTAMAIDNRR
jgi:hypothetical protein